MEFLGKGNQADQKVEVFRSLAQFDAKVAIRFPGSEKNKESKKTQCETRKSHLFRRHDLGLSDAFPPNGEVIAFCGLKLQSDPVAGVHGLHVRRLFQARTRTDLGSKLWHRINVSSYTVWRGLRPSRCVCALDGNT